MLEALHRQTGRPVAVLVDEYDKPILDALEVPDVARANRDFLRGLYATIKDCDAHVRFSFVTGVSRFSKVEGYYACSRAGKPRCFPAFLVSVRRARPGQRRRQRELA